MTLAQAKQFTSRTSSSPREVYRGRLRHAKRTHVPVAFAPPPVEFCFAHTLSY